MNRLAIVVFLLAASLLAPHLAHAQADAIPSAAPPAPTGQNDTQRGRTLIAQMVTALGGQAWLDRTTVELDGRTASFFHGQPDPDSIQYREQRRLTQPQADRIGFLTERGMVLPGKKIDVVQIWTAGKGYEVTYKGQTSLPGDQVADYYRRQAHSIEQIVHHWLKAPGMMIVYEGTTLVERRLADKVTLISSNNDAVTLDIDATTHLPLRRTFQWRDSRFHDFDQDIEEYDDYHTIQGLPTAMTITRYLNGEMVSQHFLTRVVYNQPLAPSRFDPAVALRKK